MESSKIKENNNPKLTANPISRLVFWWMYGLFRTGTKKDLEVEDLYNVLPDDVSEELGDRLEKHWLAEVSRCANSDKRPSLLRAIIKTFGWRYLGVGLMQLVHATVFRVSQPILLGLLIGYFSLESTTTLEEAYWYAGGVIGTGLVMCCTYHHTDLAGRVIGMRIRIATCSLVYRKILRLSKTALGQTAAGQVVNLLSNDVRRFDLVTVWLHYVWILPIQTAIITYYIYQLVGVAALIGVGSLFVQTVPVQSYFSKLSSRLRLKIATRTDERVQLMSEIIAGIQVIKMYAWEKPFQLIVSEARKREIHTLTKAAYLAGVYCSFMVFSERTSLFFTVVAYALLGNNVTPEKVFAMAQFYNILQCTMAIFYPQAIQMAAETRVSITRLENFLLQDEIASSVVKTEEKKDAVGISLLGATARWTAGSITDTLANINLRVAPGQLCAVIGPVGAGKSSLLHAILGELPLTRGTIASDRVVSYASQEPWLFVGTVRSNILFGQPYDARRYRDVCRVCALKSDLDMFPHGDRTVVGERGVSLSGGQRARISLARAVYRDADVYLLDDPLSAVDTHVGKHLFDDCIQGYLKGKTVVLVTHQLQHLHSADLIVIIDNGKIENQGTYEELLAGKTNFSQMLSSEEKTTEEEDAVNLKARRLRQMSESSTQGSSVEEEDALSEPDENAEFISKGNVRASLYKQYWLSGASVGGLIALALTLILGQVASSGADFWVTFWTTQEELRTSYTDRDRLLLAAGLDNASFSRLDVANVTNLFTFNATDTERKLFKDGSPDDLISTRLAIYVYAVFILGSVVITTVRSLWFMKVCMNASRGLHDAMFSSILRGTMRFFDTNPSGRVLNRFSKDMGSVDELLPKAFIDSVQVFLVAMGILVMVLLVNYWFVVPMIVVGLMFARVRTIYLASAQDLKRLEGLTRSPVFSHLSASLNGLTTIRAMEADRMVRSTFDSHQDAHTAAWYLTLTSSTTFGFWLEFLSVIFVASVTFSFLVLDGGTYGAQVGLAISQSLVLTGMLQYGIRQSAEVVSQMTSVERVLDYTDIDKEGPLESDPDKKPAKDWPQDGGIQFDHLYLKYASAEPPVLRDLNFVVRPGHKIGIVGRTGAGKSSLISALFRLAPLEGSVVIDNVDSQQIGLHDLRSRIAIIPQEPVLFSATLRYNLDPFGQFDDRLLWSALEEVELKEVVSSLEMAVNEGGANLSAGQRQLVCLARAIVRDNKILVLDEATANVDPQTDALIQATIRRRFADCTVLTIAHRLNTVMDSDRVLVMDAGTLVEYDHPYILLQNPDGYLYKMLHETGRTMSEQLRQVAEQAYNKSLEQQQDA